MANISDILYQIDSSRQIANIILNKPNVHNAFNKNMILQLTTYFKQFSQDPSVKVLTITARGKHFSAGADLNWMRESINYTEEENLQDAKCLAELFWQLYNIDKPVISLVHGSAHGGALGLLACSDVVIASENSQFCFSEVKLGLAPAVISLFMAKAMLGNFAKYSMMSARPFSAHKAYQVGLVHDVVTEDNLQLAMAEHIRQLSANNLESMIAIKKLLRQTTANITIEKLEICVQTIAKLRSSKDTQLLISKFLDKVTT
jgi:methylglutaconyl-CoA hydratase